MDTKYAGKSIVLPKQVSEELETLRVKLSEQLNFKVSLSDAVAYLLKHNTVGTEQKVEEVPHEN